MSIIGIDFGNKTTKIYNFYNGDFKIIENELNERSFQSLVAFQEDFRFFGDSAKTKQMKCIEDITFNIKSKIFDKTYESEQELHGESYSFNGFALANMYLNYIRSFINKKAIKRSLTIFTYPDYYTIDQLLQLTTLLSCSKYNPVKIIPESIAIGLDYGLYRIAKNNFKYAKKVLVIVVLIILN